MKALSIRQPWAWMILHAGKDIENRSWPTKIRGRVLIHASSSGTIEEYHHAMQFMLQALKYGSALTPTFDSLDRGGIVGSVEITNCFNVSSSPWHEEGLYGFALKDPRPCTFIKMKGSLGFFDVPDSVATMAGCL